MIHPGISAWQVEMDGPVTDYTESIFSVGNGLLGVRGYPLWARKSHPQDHALFRAGFFEEVKPGITDMVQLPDVPGMELEGSAPAAVHQSLDMRNAVLAQEWHENGLTVKMERMVSMADLNLICVRMTLLAEQEQDVYVHAQMDDRVANLPVHDDQMIQETETIRLLDTVERTPNKLVMKARGSGRLLSCYQRVFLDGMETAETSFHLHLKDGVKVVIEKRVQIDLEEDARPETVHADPWSAHARAWEKYWRDCDIQVDAPEEIQGALRWNILQMLCAAPPAGSGLSIGARGLTHGRYKGNTFWDTDIFLLPFYCWHAPEAARTLMDFRLAHLPEAKALAAKQNLMGARYPWMCSADGTEQCESWDIGLCEVHITADVAYALERMTAITGDKITPEAQRLILETARYWRGRLTWEEKKQQFSSFYVKGPDEYCGAAINNTFTNYMARHNVELALRHAGEMITPEERKELRFFADHIALLYDPEKHLYAQDEVFDRLEPLPPVQGKGGPLYRQICFDRMQRYRALKQADLVQLMVLFPAGFTAEEKQAVWNTYEPLAVHDSSLSFGVHAHLAFQLEEKEKAWDYFTRSLFLDLRDELSNTGREGVHMAALGATWQALVYGALGLWPADSGMSMHPRLPEEIQSVSLCLYCKGQRYRITVNHDSTDIQKED